jgi:hypothetical protein
VTSDAGEIADNAASAVQTAISQATNAAKTASTEADEKLQNLASDIKTQLPSSYKIGIWGDCQKNTRGGTNCTTPSTSFSFDLEKILGSVSKDVASIIPDFDKLHAASQTLSQWSISAYIIGFLLTAATFTLGVVNMVSARGNVVTAFSSFVSYSKSKLNWTNLAN